MRNVSLFAGGLGLLVLVIGVIGRFVKQPSITMLGHSFQASNFLVLANTFLLIGIFLYLMSTRRDQ